MKRSIFVALLTVAVSPNVALAAKCPDGTNRIICPKITNPGIPPRPTIIPVLGDYATRELYLAALERFRKTAIEDRAAGKLTESQLRERLGQYRSATSR